MFSLRHVYLGLAGMHVAIRGVRRSRREIYEAAAHPPGCYFCFLGHRFRATKNVPSFYPKLPSSTVKRE